MISALSKDSDQNGHPSSLRDQSIYRALTGNIRVLANIYFSKCQGMHFTII